MMEHINESFSVIFTAKMKEQFMTQQPMSPQQSELVFLCHLKPQQSELLLLCQLKPQQSELLLLCQLKSQQSEPLLLRHLQFQLGHQDQGEGSQKCQLVFPSAARSAEWS